MEGDELTGLWESRTKGERGGEIVVSERWVAPTKVEPKKVELLSCGREGLMVVWVVERKLIVKTEERQSIKFAREEQAWV